MSGQSSRLRWGVPLVLLVLLVGSVAVVSATPGSPSSPSSPKDSGVSVGPLVPAPASSSTDHVLGFGQNATLTLPVPDTGTPPYSWNWLYSTNNGVTFAPATSAICPDPHGTGVAPGARVTCRFTDSSATPPGTYVFELRVRDSASEPESVLSTAPFKVTALPAPAGTATTPKFDTDPGEFCTGSCTQANWFAGTGGSGALTVTTTLASELLILEITDSGQTGSPLLASDVSDSQTSTWHLASTNVWNGSGWDQYLLYAIDATAGTDTITLDSVGTGTTASTATALLAAYTGVDTSAPVETVGAFASGTGTTGLGNVTANVSPTTIVGVLSASDSASSIVPTTAPAFSLTGSENDAVATQSYFEGYSATTTGTYLSQPTWTGSVAWGEEAIAIEGASPLSVTVTPTVITLDQSQSKTFTAAGAGGSGTLTYAWSVSSGTCPGLSASSTASQAYTPTGTTTNCVLTVTVTDTPGDSAQPAVLAAITVNTALSAPAAPSDSAAALDVDQPETISGTLASTGTAPYSWQWEDSVNGAAYGSTSFCATNSGSGASGGAGETCAVPGSTLTAGDTYAFKLVVTDSASTPVMATSGASATITVKSALTAPAAPTVTATALDLNQAVSASGTIPSTGTSTYAWQWLISINGGAYAAASQCGTSSGTGGTGGTVKTCAIAASALTAGNTYSFELEVTDSATSPESETSAASPTVTVHSTLTAASTPSPSATKLDVNQALTVTSTLSSTGTSPYAWQWEDNVNGGGYADSTFCATNSGSGASGGALETCSIPVNTLTASDTYVFKLIMTDSATSAEMATTAASSTVTVASTLTAPTAPTLSATALDFNQALTVTGTVPTTGTATYSYQWLVSIDGGSFADATQCSHNSGSGAAAGATEMCTIAASSLAVGDTYAFEFQVTDGATSAESGTSIASGTVVVTSTLTAPGAPTLSASLLDADQTLTVSGTVSSTGTAPYAWQWLVAVNAGGYAATTQCASNSGSGATAGAPETCSISGGGLTAGDSYKFELMVTDSASSAESATSGASSSVAVSAALAAPSAPTITSDPVVDLGQTSTVTGTLPSTGTGPYAWQWLYSTNGGSSYAPATSAQCAAPSGSGGSGGATETCSFATTGATPTGSYEFELKVTDSATTSESATSPASPAVTVNSALTAPSTPSPSATALDEDQALTVTSTVPSTGTAPYGWQWLESVNGGSFAAAGSCAVSSGSGALAGATETCSVPGNTLTPGDGYGFELKVTDSATVGVSSASTASATVTVSAALTPAAAPSPSASALDLNQALTVSGTIPGTGTAPYSWQWRISTNGGTYLTASQCGGSASGSGALAGAGETCSIPASTLTAGDSYVFELEVTDHATVPETSDSVPSPSVVVSPTLLASAAPTPTAGTLDANQATTVTAHLPTTGTAPYSWQWLLEVNGVGGYSDATACGASASGSGGTGNALETCAIPAGTLTTSDSYTFEIQVTDSATSVESSTSAASSVVTANSALTAPGAPVIASNPVVDLGQTSTLTAALPSTGSAPYAWTWLYSTNGGSSYSTATTSQCATPSGTGGGAGATETCSFVTTGATSTGSYLFELKVTDSATTAETATSAASSAVTVHSALTAPAAPGVSASKLDLDQALTVSGTVPSSGTTPYGWQWLVSVNLGAYAAATQCAVNSGSGASGGAPETCSVAGNSLTAGDSYTFELKITDSATVPTSATSSASGAVAVSAVLVAPAAPTISSGSAVDLGQSAVLTATLPTTGTAPYAWSWEFSTNGGASYSSATTSQCAVPSGSAGSAGATETCTFSTSGSTPTGSYLFELKVTDSASATESGTSSPSPAVAVNSALTAPGAPTVSATSLDADQSLTVTGASLPATGTSPYGWHWMVSVNGGAYVSATQCNVNGGSGASSGARKLCVIPGGTLSASTTYAFELHVNDSASSNEAVLSPSSPTVTTSSSLTAGTPTPAAPVLDLGQSILLSANPSGGSGDFTAFQWFNASSSAGCGAAGSAIVGANNSTILVAPTTRTYYCYNVTDSNLQNATSAALEVVVNPALTAPLAPTVSAALLDSDQPLLVEGVLPTNGSANFSWVWMVSVNGATPVAATQCAANNGTNGVAAAVVTCAIAPDSLSAGDTFAFLLNVTDSATSAENATSPASVSVAVSSALTAPAAPTLSGVVLDVNQILTVTGVIPSTGTHLYAWAWWVSVNGATPISATVCASPDGASAAAGASVRCVVPADTLTAGDNYSFTLRVVDSATVAENATSAPSLTVTVHTALVAAAAPAVSATKLDADQALTVTAVVPSMGTAPYAWEWLVSANGSAYAAATVCAINQGTGAAAGATETCAVSPNLLSTGTSYEFELSARDSASLPSSVTTSASTVVVVTAPLRAGPLAPTAPAIDAGQSIVLSASATGGAPALTYQWYSGASAAACTALGSPLAGGDTSSVSVTPSTATYYCYTVSDSASAPENVTSPAVEVAVNSALTAPAAPTPSATSIGSGQGLTITATIPTTGTPTYAWQWLVSTNGGPFVNATQCETGHGSGASGGSTETCVIPAGALIAGNSYQFQLRVTDAASQSSSVTSVPSATVDVAAGAASSFPWLWVAVGVAVVAGALVAVLMVRRRRAPSRRTASPETGTPSSEPASVPIWRESAEAAPALAAGSPPIWQEKADPPPAPEPLAPGPVLPAVVSAPSPPPSPEPPATVRPVPVPAPSPVVPAPIEPVRPAPAAEVAPATEPPPAAPAPVPTPPPEVPAGKLDFDSVMAELDDLSRQILRKSQRPTDDESTDSKSNP